MTSITFEHDENVILESEDVSWISRDGENIDRFVLTNKRLYCEYKKSNGLFKKATNELCVFLLTDIRIIDGQVQVQQTKYEGEYCLHIQFIQGHEYFLFIKLNRLQNFSLEDFQKQIRDTITRYVKDTVANAPASHNIPVVQLESKTAQINDAIEYDIKERLKENFGVVVSGVDVGAIEIDKSSEGYRQLMAVTKDVTTIKIEAETQDYMERLRIQREEGQYAQHKQTQSANIGAFQVEKQAEVGMAGAEALGHMGDSGAGSVSLGDGSVGFNPAAMMAGMTVGGTVGQNIAGTMRGIMAGVNQSVQMGTTPPPIPIVTYHVAVSGQATGPYDINTLAQMATVGQFSADSLVWKAGMSQWAKAETVDELKDIFTNIPPAPPIE